MARYSKENKHSVLNKSMLRDMGLAYVGRFATSRARLTRYLDRKIAERGWGDEAGPDVAGLVDHFAALGYVDDAAYARMKSASMQRRGLGARRIGAALREDGVGEEDRAAVTGASRGGAGEWEAADIFARRKRIGPYAADLPMAELPSPDMRMKLRKRQLAAFLRAGHSMDMALRWVDAAPGEFPERDDE